MEISAIVVAGATGELGKRIVQAAIERNAKVKALVRPGGGGTRINLESAKSTNLEIVEVDYNNSSALEKACSGSRCVISALAGLQEVVIDAQKQLLDAAVSAGVARFIPSDFSLDFTKTLPGGNRNLDMRRDFHAYLAQKNIAATSIYNGAFTNLLIGPAPIILSKIKRILYWGNPDQAMDFTSMDNVAEFTAAAALDNATPRSLHIAGDTLSPRQMAVVLSEVTGEKYKLLRAGSLGLLSNIISVTRALKPAKRELYPAWQGMQYLRDMASGLGKPQVLDNNRYPGIKWQTVSEFLISHAT